MRNGEIYINVFRPSHPCGPMVLPSQPHDPSGIYFDDIGNSHLISKSWNFLTSINLINGKEC